MLIMLEISTKGTTRRNFSLYFLGAVLTEKQINGSDLMILGLPTLQIGKVFLEAMKFTFAFLKEIMLIEPAGAGQEEELDLITLISMKKRFLLLGFKEFLKIKLLINQVLII